jgi:hypothetical protein
MISSIVEIDNKIVATLELSEFSPPHGRGESAERLPRLLKLLRRFHFTFLGSMPHRVCHLVVVLDPRRRPFDPDNSTENIRSNVVMGIIIASKSLRSFRTERRAIALARSEQSTRLLGTYRHSVGTALCIRLSGFRHP